MKITWLGQAGVLIRSKDKTVLIDPYFSDCVGKIDPNKTRRMPVEERFLDLHPDVLIFTHDHIDHYDPETAPRYLEKTEPIMVLSPASCWNKARQFGGAHNYVQFDVLTEWTEGHLRFTAVKAVHSDPYAIGVVIEGEGKCVYVTGDTLYSRAIFPQLPANIDVVFLPVNGVGNNMNMADAARFAESCGAKIAVPVHWGMMDDLDPAAFAFEPKYIPEIYKEFEI